MMEGQILHRDSLGSEQVIRPGQVNLMTAGRGVAHTEDSLPGEAQLHAAQLWIALPLEIADAEPTFQHYPRLPSWLDQGIEFTLLAGEFADQTAPTQVHSPLVGWNLTDMQTVAILNLCQKTCRRLPRKRGSHFGIRRHRDRLP
jgi:quercetin 2,3-dioxygenase